MLRFEKVSLATFRDTETDHKMMIWDVNNGCFINLAQEVSDALNLSYARRLRQGGLAPMCKLEFVALNKSFQALPPGNNLIIDIQKLCDLISKNIDKITFGS